MNTRDMSVEAKERAFQKDRVFTAAQGQWLSEFRELSRALAHDRLVRLALRDVLHHLGASRAVVLEWAEAIAKPLELEHKEIVKRFQTLLRTVKVAFPADDTLRVRVRDLAMMCGVTPTEVLEAST